MLSDLQNAAIVFMQKNQAQHLSGARQLLVNRCIDHLLQISDVSASKAERISLQALGEVESGGFVYIDQAAGTDF